MRGGAWGVFSAALLCAGGGSVADVYADVYADDYEEDCACTLEYRTNICVTVDGSEVLSDTLDFLRERQDGSRDSLEYHPRCFGELVGTQRILMLRGGTVIDSSAWFTTRRVDCCHGEAKTIEFVRVVR